MTKKKIHAVSSESRTAEIEARTNFFLDQVSDLVVSTIHFFDEASVTKTTMNRRYENSITGTPAFEIQRSASNATFTINLLHSCLGFDFVNILEGPCNGNELLIFFEEAVELLIFFEEAVEITRRDGSVLLERGVTVIIDNCPFRHGRFTERALRDLLGEYGVNLLFQPPYSPHLNTCELCFHQIKAFLNRNQLLAASETEIAIHEACDRITQQNSMSYFRHCGYLI